MPGFHALKIGSEIGVNTVDMWSTPVVFLSRNTNGRLGAWTSGCRRHLLLIARGDWYVDEACFFLGCLAADTFWPPIWGVLWWCRQSCRLPERVLCLCSCALRFIIHVNDQRILIDKTAGIGRRNAMARIGFDGLRTKFFGKRDFFVLDDRRGRPAFGHDGCSCEAEGVQAYIIISEMEAA